MTRVLLQFGVVLVVILLGFTSSFFALYGEAWKYSYGEVLLELFKAILGDVELFEKIAGHDYSEAATVLLVVYLVVMTIMLLNLLIAVLSTAYSSVHENIAVEHNVSRARIIRHYVLVVKKDLLPAPFNLLHLPFWLTYWIMRIFSEEKAKRCCAWAKKGVGVAVFWIFFCPIVVILGSLKAISGVWLYDMVKQYRKSATDSYPSPMRMIVKIPLVTPFLLVMLWLVGGIGLIVRFLRSCSQQFWGSDSATSSQGPMPSPDQKHVTDMLGKSLGGLSIAQLRQYLDDPMSDLVVRPDESSKSTMVEHLKLLRNSLKEAYVAETRKLERRVEQVDNRMGELEDMLVILAKKS